MNRILLIIVSLVLLSEGVFGQDNFGFYGKKTYIEVASSMYTPLLYNLTEYKAMKLTASGDGLEAGNDWFNIGGRIGLGRTLSSRFGINLEAGFDQFTINRQMFSNYEGSAISHEIQNHESLRMRSLIFLPRLEVSGPNGLLPNGLVHQFGIGMTVSKVIRDEYLIVYVDGTTSLTNSIAPHDPEELLQEFAMDGTFYGIQLMYGFKMRTPITKWLMLHYGIRLTIDIVGYPMGTNTEYIQGVDFPFNNFIAFDMGVSLPF